MKTVLWFRSAVARHSDLCVLPQKERLADFVAHTQRTKASICVWNCPRRDEVTFSAESARPRLKIYYHGSITPARVPPQLVTAAARLEQKVTIQLAGHEAPGCRGYLEQLKKQALELGDRGLIEIRGPVLTRKELLETAAAADIGLSFIPPNSSDINLRYMVGASNKPFDYMACGLPFLVAEDADWVSTFVTPGYARSCNVEDADSIEKELRWFLLHPEERKKIGDHNRKVICDLWNYDTMFENVFSHLSA
jgi:glycosyltransferase involved in cell wall biosynthesis